jgi:hypothetical protein
MFAEFALVHSDQLAYLWRHVYPLTTSVVASIGPAGSNR